MIGCNLKITDTSSDSVFFKNEVCKPKILIQNPFQEKRKVRLSAYIMMPSGEKVYILSDKNFSLNPNRVKEIFLFNDGLTITNQYPSGLYYIIGEMVDLSNKANPKVFDAYPFYIESRTIFPSGQNLYNIASKAAMPFHHIFGYGHYSSFANLNGVAKTLNDMEHILQVLKYYGVNLMRNFMLDGVRAGANIIFPWKIVNGMYDLTQTNEAYYNRLRQFLELYRKYEFIFQLDLTDHYTMYNSTIWPQMPLHPDNNIQQSFGFPRKNTAFPEWYNIRKHYKSLWNVLEDYLTRISHIIKDYDNVICLIMNEPRDGSDDDIVYYHSSVAEVIKSISPNTMIAANVETPSLLSSIIGMNEIEILEVHGAAGVRGVPPFGNYNNSFENYNAVLIPDEDGCWENRTPSNSIKRMEKVINQSGMMKYIQKGPLPGNNDFDDWIPFLKAAKNILSI